MPTLFTIKMMLNWLDQQNPMELYKKCSKNVQLVFERRRALTL